MTTPKSPSLDQKLALTYEEAADLVGVDESTIRRWVREKGLPVCRIGRVARIRHDDLDAFVLGHRCVTGQEPPSTDPVVQGIVDRIRGG